MSSLLNFTTPDLLEELAGSENHENDTCGFASIQQVQTTTLGLSDATPTYTAATADPGLSVERFKTLPNAMWVKRYPWIRLAANTVLSVQRRVT